MTIIKKYTKPCITIVVVNSFNILCSSDINDDKYKYICSKFCKFWHLCRDRSEYKVCLDKKYD